VIVRGRGLALGLFLSTLAKTQQQSMMTAFFFTMPMTSLSGFGTPISSMPVFFQVELFQSITSCRFHE